MWCKLGKLDENCEIFVNNFDLSGQEEAQGNTSNGQVVAHALSLIVKLGTPLWNLLRVNAGQRMLHFCSPNPTGSGGDCDPRRALSKFVVQPEAQTI